jgi:dsDNA-specific endonuclease/ATPase MutS2
MKKSVKSWLKVAITTMLLTFFILIVLDSMNKLKETFDGDEDGNADEDDEDEIEDDDSSEMRSIDRTIRMKKENIAAINQKALDDDRGLTGDEIKKMKSNLNTIRQLQNIRDLTSSGPVSSTIASTRNRLTSLLSG